MSLESTLLKDIKELNELKNLYNDLVVLNDALDSSNEEFNNHINDVIKIILYERKKASLSKSMTARISIPVLYNSINNDWIDLPLNDRIEFISQHLYYVNNLTNIADILKFSASKYLLGYSNPSASCSTTSILYPDTIETLENIDNTLDLDLDLELRKYQKLLQLDYLTKNQLKSLQIIKLFFLQSLSNKTGDRKKVSTEVNYDLKNLTSKYIINKENENQLEIIYNEENINKVDIRCKLHNNNENKECSYCQIKDLNLEKDVHDKILKYKTNTN